MKPSVPLFLALAPCITLSQALFCGLVPLLCGGPLITIAKQSSKSRELASYHWPVTGPVKGLVFISHGYAEHLRPYYNKVGRYLKTFFVPYYSVFQFGRACGSFGLLCFGHDHIGHGRSPGVRTVVASMDEYTRPL